MVEDGRFQAVGKKSAFLQSAQKLFDDFTFDNVRRVAGAISYYVLKHENSKNGVVVGYDTRFASQRVSREASEVLAGAGIPVILASDYSPTPAISYAVKTRGAAGGVVITSSHNPWNWNGVKFKAKFGGSATPAIMKVIEDELHADTRAREQIGSRAAAAIGAVKARHAAEQRRGPARSETEAFLDLGA